MLVRVVVHLTTTAKVMFVLDDKTVCSCSQFKLNKPRSMNIVPCFVVSLTIYRGCQNQKHVNMAFRATLNFLNLKVALNPMYNFLKLCQKFVLSCLLKFDNIKKISLCRF